jgi:hypothetical protein
MAYTKLQIYLIDESILLGISAIVLGLVMAMLSTVGVGGNPNLFGRGMTITMCGFCILVCSFGMMALLDDGTKTPPKGELK